MQQVAPSWEAVMQAEDQRGGWNITRPQLASAVAGRVTKRELSAHLGVSTRLIEYCESEGMPSVLHNRKRYYDAAVAEQWLNARQRRMQAAQAAKEMRDARSPSIRFVTLQIGSPVRRPACVRGVR